MPRQVPCPMKTQLRLSQRCTLLASLPRSKLCLKNCAGGVHDQLWQKRLWKETPEVRELFSPIHSWSRRPRSEERVHRVTAFDYRPHSSENKRGTFFDFRPSRCVGLWRSWERASMAWKRSSVRSRPGPPNLKHFKILPFRLNIEKV